jgi:lipopolysaccharide transport system permease protein
VVVESGRRAPLDWRELWSYRDLFYLLTWRDVKVRYKQTLLGVAWAVLQPLLPMVVFALVFGRLAGMPSDGIPYPLFVYAGLLPWTFFANAVTVSGNSLVGSANLITKVYFPRILVPTASVAAALVDLTVACVALGVLLGVYRVSPGWSLVLLPVFVLLTALAAVGFGLWSAALNVKYRDVRYALPFLVQLGMFVTPVVYPLSLVPDRWRWVLALNPLTGVVEGYRSCLFGRPPELGLTMVSVASTVVVLLIALLTFRRAERSFADVV